MYMNNSTSWVTRERIAEQCVVVLCLNPDHKLRLIDFDKTCLSLCLFEIICWKSNGHKLQTRHSIQNSPGQSKGNVEVQECVSGKLYQTPGGEAVIFKRGIFTGIGTSYVVRGTLAKKEPPKYSNDDVYDYVTAC